ADDGSIIFSLSALPHNWFAGLIMSLPRIADRLPKSREEEFYTSYGWCLNPIRRLDEILDLLEAEFIKLPNISELWQQEESMINLHLFVGAITCIVDDYLAWVPFYLQPLRKKFHFPLPIALLDSVLNFP